MDDKFYYTPEEVAKLCKVAKRTISEWCRTEKIKGIKIGKMWRISRDEVQKLLSEIEAE